MAAIPQHFPAGIIGRVIEGIGNIAGAIASGIARSGYTACFMKKTYKVTDLVQQFGISVAAFEHANPHLTSTIYVAGGTVVLIPGIRGLAGPYDKSRRDDFSLTPAAAGPPIFHDTIHKDGLRDPKWMPAKPPFKQANRESVFGRFDYVDDPSENEPDGIRITGGWEGANITSVVIPQIEHVKKGGKTRFNKKYLEQFRGLFAAWEKAGLTRHIISWDGGFNARYMRNATHDRAHLSNHAWGTAFDINAKWNKLGKPVAKLGKTGCVLELVEISYDYGFYWGGYFGGGRSDGMHFEVAKAL